MSLLNMDMELFKIQMLALSRYTKNMSVLIVEDYETLQKSLHNIFGRLFGEADVASDGVQALELYRKKSYDIVFSDIAMPHMNGVELTKEIKKINKNQPIIIFSAHQESGYLLELINLDVRRFILKPISLGNLLDELLLTCKSLYDEKDLSSTLFIRKNIVYSYKDGDIYIDEKPILLSKQERFILELFISKINLSVSAQEIVDHLYYNGFDIDIDNVRKMVYRLRKKISDDIIENIHSIGYRIKKEI